MKAFRKVVLPLCVVFVFPSHAATAQTNTPAPAIRRYDSRIQMHAAPVTLQVPKSTVETQEGTPEPSAPDLMLLDSLQQELQTPPNGPRRKAMPEKKQDKTWLLPSSTETKKKKDEDRATPNQQEESSLSGWGWLADDVQARRQEQKEEDADNDNSEEKGNDLSPALGQKKEVKPKTDGILLDTAFKPVSGSTATKESEKKDDEDTVASDESQKERRSQTTGPTTAESPSSRKTSADQPRQQQLGANATWGNESLWNRNSKSAGALPQTEALLSISKPDERRPIAGLDRPSFKPDVGGGAVHRAEADQPPLAPKTFVAAASFQPLPAAPVNDLGNISWGGGLPDKASFGVSTPFSREATIAPSQPVEALKAPELPKPMAMPWLK